VGNFVSGLLGSPQPTLAGFDFPIGLPAAFGQKTRFSSFIEAIVAFGIDEWSRFYEVSESAEDISLHRPFYPRVASSSARQAHLLRALGVDNVDALRRQCERATNDRRAACVLFWTLGGNQVGKAAICGWQEVVHPARREGALLWPFDGTLPSLAGAGRLVICETYPAEAYRHVDVKFRRGGRKQNQADRREATVRLPSRCAEYGVELADALLNAIRDGFGSRKSGEDPFDAAMGLLSMVEVVEGRRAAAPTQTPVVEWEGWILGQVA
jgi:hypothetical protein